MSRLHIADTGLFVAMGQLSNSRYQAVRWFARRSDVAETGNVTPTMVRTHHETLEEHLA